MHYLSLVWRRRSLSVLLALVLPVFAIFIISAGDSAADDAVIIIPLATGNAHTCALLDRGAVRCWGAGSFGRLGYGNTDDIGDDEIPASAGYVDVGGTVTQIAAGSAYTCALLDTGAVRCWGPGDFGLLGYGNTDDIGDDETPASAGDVKVGGTVTQIAAGGAHTCALLDTGAVRCWGAGVSGRLGYGNTDDIGDDEPPAEAGDVDVGGTVTQIAAVNNHTCALLDTGAVRCWGLGGLGKLGYGNTDNIGDDETPASAGDVDVGGIVGPLVCNGLVATIVGTDSQDVLMGTLEKDVIMGLAGSDIIIGLDGDDTICAGSGDDIVDGGDGDDWIDGDRGDDRINGGDGDDWIDGDRGDDLINGGAGKDTLLGSRNRDFILGGLDDDWIEGNEGNDEIAGGGGVDLIFGDDGNDRLLGDDGDDMLFGGRGDDTLDCGDGSDIGDGGRDTDTNPSGDCELTSDIP